MKHEEDQTIESLANITMANPIAAVVSVLDSIPEMLGFNLTQPDISTQVISQVVNSIENLVSANPILIPEQ